MFRLLPLLAVTALAAAPAPPPYPEGFRTWNHVKSMEIGAGHSLVGAFEGLHHVYVNDVGLPTAKAGSGRYPDGTVLVFDLLEAEHAGGATTEGARKFTAIMTKNARTYAGTGGWGFEVFQGDGRTRAVSDGGASCFSCHEAQAGTDYVFARWRP